MGDSIIPNYQTGKLPLDTLYTVYDTSGMCITGVSDNPGSRGPVQEPAVRRVWRDIQLTAV